MTLWQTNICPPWPEYVSQKELLKLGINEYVDFASALFSLHAHPIFKSFSLPTATRSEVLGSRDCYLRHRFPHLVRKDYDLRERKPAWDADFVVNEEWNWLDFVRGWNG